MTEQVEVLEAAQEHFLVIAAKDAHAPSGLKCAGGVNDSGTLGPAINQIAEQHDGGLCARAGGVVGLDRGNQGIEQVKPAVDIAHGIDPRARRDPGQRRRGLRPEELAERFKHKALPRRAIGIAWRGHKLRGEGSRSVAD